MARRSRWRSQRRKTRRTSRKRKAQKGGGLPLLAGLAGPAAAAAAAPTFQASFPGLPFTEQGPLIQQARAQDPPSLAWTAEPATLYTVIAWDPDAPSPAAPTKSPWLHWLAVNLSGPTDPLPAQISWAPPTPPEGQHRYIIGLFQQQAHIDPPQVPQRNNFPLQSFVADNGLTFLSYKGFRVNTPRVQPPS